LHATDLQDTKSEVKHILFISFEYNLLTEPEVFNVLVFGVFAEAAV